MNREEIKEHICKRLAFNTPPKMLNYNSDIDRHEYHEILTELIEDGLITANTYEDHPVFKGEYKDIKLSDYGKTVYKGTV